MTTQQIKIRFLGPPHFRPQSASLPVAVPSPGSYARGNSGLVSCWWVTFKIEITLLEVFQ